MPDVRLMAVVPMRNEAQRYLQSCLTHLRRNVGVTHILVVDDGSDDGSFGVALATLQSMVEEEPNVAWRIVKRPDHVAPFLVHEAEFRSWILQALVSVFNPTSEVDWILVNDADEYICTKLSAATADTLHGIIDSGYADCLLFGLDELWQLDPPLRRIDKAWGTQRQARAFRYRANKSMTIPPRAMASGSVPGYARESTLDVHRAVRIVHAGYADPDDRGPKYDRYMTRAGHSEVHIKSILDDDVQLQDIGVEPPKIWRGVR